ncbi:MAG: lyase family protein, partial [Thermomicrobiales bacterium]
MAGEPGKTRIVRDSMGEMSVPAEALYGASTARAVKNFPISGIRFSRAFLRALGLIKASAAKVNADLGLLDSALAASIEAAALEVSDGKWDDEFPLDIFQTGSGTSTNTNANEVIATLAASVHPDRSKPHPNDHVNMCQSSNDTIPTAIHVAAYLEIEEMLLPAMRHLEVTLRKRAAETRDIVKTGRTHLMDATPVRLGDEIGGWAAQVRNSRLRIESSLPRLAKLAQGGTAVGSGLNAHPEFG